MGYSLMAWVLAGFGVVCVVAGWVVTLRASATPSGLVMTYPWPAVGLFAAGLVLLASGAAASSRGES
jgi:FtsH-binding integral membrane protein